ncbi:TonB-dependent receptor [Thalassotalea sp. G2M2-11]|uniref:TonB-dependent receptor n=1 Tax=Thalassotalea sp. G2M2-11 TaxID=2787627 RepID=UPI001F49B83F|nr:TonB-dependent receptor [Thalassotalea sp. G2M2-11]
MNFQKNTFKQSVLASSILLGLFAPTMVFAEEVANEKEVSKVEQANVDDIEVIYVRGIRSSIVKSINNKRFADSVVDSITATDIGKLPDVTIADSLQRVTGVQISRSGGEGAQVNVRGVPQVATTLNGEQMLSAGSVTTVQPNFADVPSTMVSGIDVIKSAQAKNVVSGLAGTIDLQTVRPIYLEEGYTLVGKAEVVDGSMGKDTDKKFSTFAAYNLDSNTAVSLNLSYDDVNLADYLVGSSGEDWGFNATEASNFVTENVDANGDGDFDDMYYAFQGHQASNRFIERERTGLNITVQHQINDEFQITGDVFYTKLDEHQYQAGFIASQAWQGETGWFTPNADGFTAHENIVDGSDIGGSYNSFNSGVLQARRTMVHSETHAVEKEALNTNLVLSYEGEGAFTGKLRWVHGEAKNDQASSYVDAYVNSGAQVGATHKGPGGEPTGDVNPWGYDGELATLPDGTPVEGAYTQIPIGIAYGNNQMWTLPTMSVMNEDGTVTSELFGSNIDRYSHTSGFLDGTNRNAELDVIRFDGNWLFDFEHLISVDFGARYAVREVEQQAWRGVVARTNAYGDPFLAHWKDSASQAPDTLESYIDLISFNDPALAGKITQISDFQGASGLGALYFVDPKAMKNPLAYHQELYGTIVQAPQSEGTYNLEEITSTLYAQANFAGEISGYKYSANLGVRYVKTEYDIEQTESGSGSTATFGGVEYIVDGALGTPAPAAGTLRTKRDYDDVLPAFNAKVELNDDMIMRFAYSKTLTVHDTNNLAGGITVNRTLSCGVQKTDGSSVFCATGGNQQGSPYLDPWRSDNFEASYEWYFSESGMFSLGAFYMDIESFITRETVMLEVPDSDGEVRGYDLNTGAFTGKTPIQSVANGAGGSIKGMEVSYHQGLDFLVGFWSGFGITANYTYSPSESGSKDYYGDDTPMIDNSEHQSNLAIWYENDGLQARIAHNYRSEKFMWLVNKDPYHFARFQSPTNYIDASVSYDFNENVTVSLQGTNLTEEEQEQYLQWDDLVDKRYINERRVSLNVQVRM